jgi:hypothetical protein
VPESGFCSMKSFTSAQVARGSPRPGVTTLVTQALPSQRTEVSPFW